MKTHKNLLITVSIAGLLMASISSKTIADTNFIRYKNYLIPVSQCSQLPSTVRNETLIVDGNRMKYEESGKYAFLVGPGDPEGMLYFSDIKNNSSLGNVETNPDHTLAEQVSYLIQKKARMVYMMAYWNEPSLVSGTNSPFHPGTPGTQAFTDRLNEWDAVIGQLNAAGITVTFFMFDDADSISGSNNDFDTPSHNTNIPGGDIDAITRIVNKLKHHKLLIWGVMEEADKIFSSTYDSNKPSTSDMKAYINTIKQLDPKRPVGMHQQGNDRKNDFPASQGYNHNMFMLQQSVEFSPGQLYTNVKEVVTGNQNLIINLSELQKSGVWHGEKSISAVRQRNWAAAMAGVSAIQVLGMGYMDAERDTEGQGKYDDAAHLMDFMQMTDFYKMDPSPSVVLGSTNTKWALDAGGAANSTIVYSDNAQAGTKTLGVSRSYTPGSYELTWLDISGNKGTIAKQQVNLSTGSAHTWTVPSCIEGKEVALWITKQ